MALKTSEMRILARNGGFIVTVDLEEANVDGNPGDNRQDEYIVTSVAKLVKAVKDEFQDYVKPRKARAKKELV